MSAAQRPVTFWEFMQTFVVCQGLGENLPLKKSHQIICDVLEAVILGLLPQYRYVVINKPRRTGKTKILEALACNTIKDFQDAQIIYSSYSDKLVHRTIDYIQRVLRSPWYKECFGDYVHSERGDLITTTKGGNIYGAGTGATITGFGAGLKRPAGGFIGIDDPAKPDEALSLVEIDNVIQWFETTIKGCRNSDVYCPIIIDAQRLGPDDLPGYVLKTYPKETLLLKFPCFSAEGVSNFPETWSNDLFQELKKTRYGRFVLASQFQQEPVALGGNLIQTDSLLRYDATAAWKWERKIITCDTALMAKQSNDWSVLQIWGRLQSKAYLIDQIRGHWESPELLAMAQAFFKKHHLVESPVNKFTIEEKAAGIGLVQQLKRLGIPAQGIERTKDKVTRVQEVLPYIETGMVCIPLDKDAPWVGGLVSECAEFKADGTAAHDDQVDTLCDGVWLTVGKPLSSFDVLLNSQTAA
jgi:predicted phage terminase large subunit-like protein